MEEDIETCGWFVFYKDQLLIEKKNGMYTIPFGTEPPMPVPVGSTIHTIGEIEGRTAKTFSVHAPVPGSENDRHLMMDLRSSDPDSVSPLLFRMDKFSGQRLHWSVF